MRRKELRQIAVVLTVSVLTGLSVMVTDLLAGAAVLAAMLGTVAVVYLFLRGREEGEEP